VPAYCFELGEGGAEDIEVFFGLGVLVEYRYVPVEILQKHFKVIEQGVVEYTQVIIVGQGQLFLQLVKKVLIVEPILEFEMSVGNWISIGTENAVYK
jgi:hypothetical protein